MGQDSWLSERKMGRECVRQSEFCPAVPRNPRSFPGAVVLTCESIQSESALLAKYACRYKEFDSSLA